VRKIIGAYLSGWCDLAWRLSTIACVFLINRSVIGVILFHIASMTLSDHKTGSRPTEAPNVLQRCQRRAEPCTAIGKTHQIGEDGTCSSGDRLADRHRYALITVLHTGPIHRRSFWDSVGWALPHASKPLIVDNLLS